MKFQRTRIHLIRRYAISFNHPLVPTKTHEQGSNKDAIVREKIKIFLLGKK